MYLVAGETAPEFTHYVHCIVALACAAIAFSRSATSHGADYGDFSLQEFSDWFHLLASISWGGALLSISLMFSASRVADSVEQQHIVSGIADRFYVLFGPVFAVLVFTGLYNAWVEVGSFGALLTNTYGRFLSVKLLIFAYLTSRYIAPPQKGKDEAAYATKFLNADQGRGFPDTCDTSLCLSVHTRSPCTSCGPYVAAGTATKNAFKSRKESRSQH